MTADFEIMDVDGKILRSKENVEMQRGRFGYILIFGREVPPLQNGQVLTIYVHGTRIGTVNGVPFIARRTKMPAFSQG
jgi:hypothetical protein